VSGGLPNGFYARFLLTLLAYLSGGMPNGPEPSLLLGMGAMMGLDSEGTQRTLSAYNLFVREMLRQFKEQTPDMPQVLI